MQAVGGAGEEGKLLVLKRLVVEVYRGKFSLM
jgi:hypothetical protein